MADLGIGELIALSIGTTVASTAGMGALSVWQASEQNKNLSAQANAQNQATAVQQQQLADQATQERQQRLTESQQMQERLRVSTGESGLSLGPLQRQVGFDLQNNLSTLDTNYQNQLAYVRTGAQANLAALQSQSVNPLIATATGAMQGFSTGLSLATSMISLPSAINSLQQAKAVKTDASYIGTVK